MHANSVLGIGYGCIALHNFLLLLGALGFRIWGLGYLHNSHSAFWTIPHNYISGTGARMRSTVLLICITSYIHSIQSAMIFKAPFFRLPSTYTKLHPRSWLGRRISVPASFLDGKKHLPTLINCCNVMIARRRKEISRYVYTKNRSPWTCWARSRFRFSLLDSLAA